MSKTLEGLRHNEMQSRKSLNGLDMANGCRENADCLEKYGYFSAISKFVCIPGKAEKAIKPSLFHIKKE